MYASTTRPPPQDQLGDYSKESQSPLSTLTHWTPQKSTSREKAPTCGLTGETPRAVIIYNIILNKMKKLELKVDTIYHLKNGLNGLKVCVLKSNRNNAVKNKKMKVGCQEIEMQQPAILADARPAFEAGYTLIDLLDGHDITEVEVDGSLVIVDGNTRAHAWLLSIEDKDPFTFIFQYKIYETSDAFKKAYQKINIYNTPTSAADFARDFAATTDNAVIADYRKKQSDGLCPKAAGYATIGREISKKDIQDLQNGKTPSGFDNVSAISRFSTIYNAILQCIIDNPAIYKGTEVWKFNAGKLASASDKDKMVSRLYKLYSSMPYSVGKKLEKAKKTGSKPKETVVAEILEAALAKID